MSEAASATQEAPPQTAAEEMLQIEKVRKVMLALIKAITNSRFYVPSNPLVVSSRTETHQLLSDFLESSDSIELELSGTDILYKENSLLARKDDKSQNLAFLFYRDGLRTITFHKGISLEDLDKLLEIICQAMSSPEDETDIVSAMWNADFRNISYEAVEPFVEMDQEGADVPGLDESRPKRMQGNAHENAMKMETAISPPPTEVSISRKRADQSPLLGTIDSEEIKKRIQSMVEFSPILALGGILLDLVGLNENIDERRHLVSVTEEYLKELVSQRRYTQASENLSKVRLTLKYLASSDVRYQELLDMLIMETARYVKSDAQRKNLRDAFQEDAVGVLAFIEALGPEVLSVLIELIPIATGAESKASIRTVLLNLANEDIYKLKKVVRDDNPLIAREAISVLGRMNDPRCVQLLRPCLKHNDVSVRIQALHALAQMDFPQASKLAFEFLEDSQPDVRILAARTIDASKGLTVEERLRAIVLDRSFRARPISERIALIEALKKATPEEVVDVLAPFLRRRLFRRQEVESVLIAVVRTLASIGTESARMLLEKTSKSRRKPIAMESLRLLQQADKVD